ncbi:MAG: quinone-dependent dihydroorotate dehydrogenase [Alphaproteobacteria bacterium]
MGDLLGRIARKVLFRFDPETAHRMAITALSLGLVPSASSPAKSLGRRLIGLDFPSPVGLAAGFDKNAEAFGSLLRLGFGFVEIGTVTPRPQVGNPKPRMFRLEADRAIINRLGFNNAGAEVIQARLESAQISGVIGVNIGANRDSEDRVADYVAGIDAFARLASYLVINVSSPNTPGLRDLQKADALADLLARAMAARDEATNGSRATPLLVKISPDLKEDELSAITETAIGHGVDGLIVANTTLSRDGLHPDPRISEPGGLSGRPLFARSTALLAKARKLVGAEMVLIGVGGVDSAETAWSKFAAGADLVQVYTGMIYGGQDIAETINRGLAQRLEREGHQSISAIIGRDTDHWATLAI